MKYGGFKKALNLSDLVEATLKSPDYWFRQKYNLPPTDPRYLDMESWEIILEYKVNKKIEDESRPNKCSGCGLSGHGKHCAHCGETMMTPDFYVDEGFDDYFKKVTAGETPEEDWEDVTDDGGPDHENSHRS